MTSFANLGRTFFDWMSAADHRKGARALMQLEDHMLRDIGLTREDVVAEAKREAQRKPRFWARRREPVWESATTIF